MTNKPRLLFVIAGLAALIGSIEPSFAQESDGDGIVVTGSRAANRTRLDTLAPVDVVTAKALENAGTTELNQVLAVTLPSLDFPRPAITDGTDSVRPATLRGLAPDQTLVLINSKRAHASALININGSIGRGSAAVDMNTIPTVALGTIEVLRDGASAQYGSDAIAGVINLRLREASSGGGASVTYGQYITNVETAHYKRDETDGATATVSGWAGLPLGSEGFLTVSGEYLSRDPTSRGDQDLRINGNVANSPTGSVITSRYGDPKVEQGTVFLNGGLPFGSNGWSLYGWLGYQHRETNSAANPRLQITTSGSVLAGFTTSGANTAQTVASVTPAGFLPQIAPTITDLNSALGLKGEAAGWNLDFGVSYGSNKIEYTTINTLNASIARAQTTAGLASNPYFGQTVQRSFNSGTLEYKQTVANFDATRTFNEGGALPVTLAAGLEYRNEEFAEGAGEISSYDIARTSTGAAIIFPGIATQPQGGSQGFPGLQKADAQSGDRHSYAGYIEADANVTDKLQASLAVRYEDFSDFGNTANGKFSARYDLTDAFAVRGAISSGFRAPGLQQTSFTATSTNFISGVATDILTARATSALAAALGAKPLTPELSANYSLGFVVRAGNFVATLDAYEIDVTDRIVLSDNILGNATGTPTQVAIYNLVSPYSPTATGARFFINGVDTTTKGLDVVASYRMPTETMGSFTLTATGNLNATDVTRTPTTAALSALPVPPVLFPRNRVLEFERGTPGYKAGLSVDWEKGPLGFTLRGTQYGAVLIPQTNVAGTWRQKAAFLLDTEARAQWKKVGFAIGVNNLLDQYPTKSPDAYNGVTLYGNGAVAFSSFSPFGFSGRYVYGKASYSW
jgi:iron complex outermembrane receptor protein